MSHISYINAYIWFINSLCIRDISIIKKNEYYIINLIKLLIPSK
jgi:hypothetical protein